jgi:hypothetical protein
MSVKERVLADINEIDNQHFLNQIQMFVALFKEQNKKGNKDAVLAFAGTLSDEDAAEMQKIVEEEFSNIEGDWS